MTDLLADLTPSALSLPQSGILKVFNYGRTREGLIPLWAGEGDKATPDIINEAAIQALREGQTFYTHQRGLPEVRNALAEYFTELYQRPFQAEEFFMTCGGMQAIQMAAQLVIGAGDEVVVPAPAWPNFEGAVLSRGGTLNFVRMEFGADGWTFDLQKLFDACSDKTRAILINSPSNPTGWVASEDDLRAILEFARKHGIWIIADEIYGRFYFPGTQGGTSDTGGAQSGSGSGTKFGATIAPSFQTMREDGDRLLFVQTFSKNWAMTGWRMGWLQAPAELGDTIENLIQFNTSGVPTFHQPAALKALTQGEAVAAGEIARAAAGREIVCQALAGRGDVHFAWPAGAFYLLFGIKGETNSLESSIRLVDEANIGLAPGSAFGPEGEGYFRICYLRSPDQLHEAMRRLTTWLDQRR